MSVTEPEGPSETARALAMVAMAMLSGFYIGWLAGVAMA